MIFSSPRFFVFMLVLLLSLRVVRPLEWRLRILLVASCFFYAAWDYRYLGLLLLVSAINWECGRRIYASTDPRPQRTWVMVSVVSSLGILAWFKYANFFVDNLNLLLAHSDVSLPHLDILLPAGISFYVFKTMSYTIDIHRGDLVPTRSPIHYATFATFFPELIAGPIVRGSVFLPQMGRDIGPTPERMRVGLSLFLLGLTKKTLVADPLSSVADPMFAAPLQYSGASLWFGVLAYTLQIYCDFSGYSDMAIGCGKMIGYDLPRNFRMPYLSGDVAEFWRRWHITLSTWLRDYLYIPLGGNRGGKARTYMNLAITMLLGGLWHGASWNFVLWGGLHGSALAGHRLLRERLGDRFRVPRPIAVVGTFFFVMLAWVPFRSPDFTTTGIMLGRMLTLSSDGTFFVPVILFASAALVVLAHLAGVAVERQLSRRGHSRRFDAVLHALGAETGQDEISGWYLKLGFSTVPGMAVVMAWLLAIYFFAPTGTSPFIYFQF